MKRRTLLRGLGTVAIALPFMDEFGQGVGRADGGIMGPGSGVPERLVTLFFGLGLDPSWQQNFDSPFGPYRPFADKMAFFSVNAEQGSAGGAHCNTSTVVFVGEEQNSTNVAGGPSIDQLVRRNCDPTAPTLASGLWWRRGACDAQALRVFNADGSSRPPIKRPSDVFDQVFGSYLPPPDPGETGPEQEARRRDLRTRRSILDGVLGEYQHFRGDRSPRRRLSWSNT